MALAGRTRALSHCSACIRIWPTSADVVGPLQATGWRLQTRGTKKLAKPSECIPARLLKDLPGFGKKGAIVPMACGQMRNHYFPSRIADYITRPELRTLRAQNVPIERDYTFGKKEPDSPADDWSLLMSPSEESAAHPASKAPDVEKLTGERSLQLLEIFVPQRMDFYRQPIVEETKEMKDEKVEEAQQKYEKRQRTASSAATDLLAARTQKPLEKAVSKLTGAIYGSVSQHDILIAVRASMATNDEAARVVVTEQDIDFLSGSVQRDNKIKELGDFAVRIRVKGEEGGVKRTVRVIAQEPER